MFALAVWDSTNKSLLLARDRLGIKPLYYYFDGQTFVFGSELKSIVAFESLGIDIDYEAIPLFLHYQYIPAPRTIYRHIYKLPPGHLLNYKDGYFDVKAYWEIPTPESNHDLLYKSENEHIEELDTLLNAAVRDRLVSDVPLGALLSGGIDSSTVVALMQRNMTTPVRTFSIGFNEADYNEAPWATKIAEHLGTDHTELYVSHKEAQEVIPSLPLIYDEPFADSSAIPTYIVCKLARSALTVALSGDGGDEQFAGYVRYWSTEMMYRHIARIPSSLKFFGTSFLESIRPSAVKKIYMPVMRFLPERLKVKNFEDKWEKLLRFSKHTELSDIYRMTIDLWADYDIRTLLGVAVPRSNYETLFEKSTGSSILSRLMRVDQGTYLPDAMLTKIDRASMAVSLEVRVPLLDHRVVHYTAGLPEKYKLRSGQGKYLLKKLLARYVPEPLFNRPKMGFGIPIGLWLRNDLKPLLLDYLSDEAIKKEGRFDRQFVKNIVDEHLSGRANHQYRLWTLLMWEMWREKWKF
jgi:asparagine synthase (glutamine-hydrolysing)